MYKVTVSSKGQVSLPAELRRKYDLEQGDVMLVQETEAGLVLFPLPKQPLLNLRGKYRKDQLNSLTAELLETRVKERERDK